MLSNESSQFIPAMALVATQNGLILTSIFLDQRVAGNLSSVDFFIVFVIHIKCIDILDNTANNGKLCVYRTVVEETNVTKLLVIHLSSHEI